MSEDLLRTTADRALRYRAGLAERTVARTGTSRRGRRGRRFLGDGRAQMAQCPLRQRPRLRARRRAATRGDGGDRRVSPG